MRHFCFISNRELLVNYTALWNLFFPVFFSLIRCNLDPFCRSAFQFLNSTLIASNQLKSIKTKPRSLDLLFNVTKLIEIFLRATVRKRKEYQIPTDKCTLVITPVQRHNASGHIASKCCDTMPVDFPYILLLCQPFFSGAT